MQQEAYQKQEKISRMIFFAKAPNFVLMLISAIASQSLLVWLNCIESLGSVLSEGIVMRQSHKMRRDLRYEYNYGIGKVEAMTTFFTSAIELVGLVCVAVVSGLKLIAPEQPSRLLIYVVLFKVLDVATAVLFLSKQTKLEKLYPSTLTESKQTALAGGLAFQCGALLSMLAVWLLREYQISWYISPILSFCIALIMMDYCFKHISHAVTELMDETLPEEQQMKILKVLNHHNGEYSRFESIRSRCNGTAVAIDLVVAFGEDTTFGQIEGFRSAVQRELEGEIPNCQVSVVLE